MKGAVSLLASDIQLNVRQVHDHLALPLLPIVGQLGLRGLPFDAKLRGHDDGVTRSGMVGDIQTRLDHLDNELRDAGISNPNSPKQLETDLLALGVPLSKRTASGNQFTVDLDVLGRIHHHYNVQREPRYPFLPALMERKRLEKARANLESLRPCLDGKLRTALRSTGTETGRYSSAGLRWCGVCKQPNHGCLLPDAEVLTKTGWVKFKDIEGDSITAAVWRDGQVFFAESGVYRGQSCGHVWEADSWFHKQVYTNGHTIPMHGSVVNVEYQPSKIVGRQVQTVATWGQFMLPLSGEYRSPTASLPAGISVAHMRLLIALQADGSFEKGNTCARWAFKKERKSERLLALAAEAGIELTECAGKPGYRRFYMSAKDGKWFKQMLGSDKNFGSWLLYVPFEVLKAMIEETQYWDATVRNKSWMYFTTNENNAEWIQTCAHLVGYSATRRVNLDNSRGYGNDENKPLWTVAIKPRSYARVSGSNFKQIDYEGPVYCLQTTTGYFLTRYNGVISVTGNTNLQNIAKNNKELGVNVKDCFVAPKGWVLWELDYSMLELRIMAYMAGVEKLIARMEDPAGDVHTANTHALFDGRYSETLRTLAKNFFYALQYGGSEGAIQMALAKKGEYLEQSYIVGLMHKMFTEYPQIALWQQRTGEYIESCKKRHEAVVARNAYGGCRVLLSSDPLKEFLSTQIQGTAAYTMSFALLRLHRSGHDEPLIGQIHDAFLGLSPEATWRRDMERVKAEMQRPVWIANRFVTLPAEGKMGERWSQLQKVKD